jgi:hypothetical protein
MRLRIVTTTTSLRLLPIRGVLLQEGCEVPDFLLVLDSGEDHFLPRQRAARVRNVSGKARIVPGQP